MQGASIYSRGSYSYLFVDETSVPLKQIIERVHPVPLLALQSLVCRWHSCINLMSSANSRNPAADDDDISFSIEALVAQLQHDSEDLDASLQNFLQDRANAVEMQKRALVEYEEEMARIEAEYNALEYGMIDPPK